MSDSIPTLIDQGGLGSTYVSMPEAEALELARRHYGLTGSVLRFATEKDDTFRLDTGDGQRYVLKIANPFEETSEVDFQTGLLQHVAARDAGIPVPRVIPNLDGAAHFRFVDRAGQPREVRLMSYLDGTPLDSTHSSPEQRERIGEMLARLRHASADFRHPAESRVLAWDVKHLASLGNLIDGVDDPAQKRQLAAGMERFLDIAPRVAALRSQVVHNDFSQSNIVVDHESADFVVGIIDFGDAVHTAIAIDVSTALLNQLPRDAAQSPVEDLFWRGRDVLRGYLRHAELTREELMLIPHLAMARAVTRGLLSLWRARMFPENKTYLLRNTEQGWAQLKWFLERSPETVSRTLLTD